MGPSGATPNFVPPPQAAKPPPAAKPREPEIPKSASKYTNIKEEKAKVAKILEEMDRK
jgi:hypothetical protein